MTLRRAFVIYETEASARARLEGFGFSPEIAAEIAVYLGQCTDLPDYRGEIEAGARARGFEAEFVELDAWPERAARIEREGALVWSVGDGVRYYRGSAVAALCAMKV